MKYLILAILCASAFGAEPVKPQAAKPDEPKWQERWEHVVDESGKTLFTIDHKDNTFEYKEKIDVVVPYLLKRMQAVVSACNQALQNQKAAEPKKSKK